MIESRIRSSKSRIGDDAVFDHFVQAGTELTTRQGFEHDRIGNDQAWRVKRSDQVLAERVIDAGLPADRAVDLREQGRRHVHDRDAAQVRRRGEADEIADHAAADRDDHRRAIRLGLDQRIEQPRDGIEVLVALAVFDEDRRPVGADLPEQRARENPRRAGSIPGCGAVRAWPHPFPARALRSHRRR